MAGESGGRERWHWWLERVVAVNVTERWHWWLERVVAVNVTERWHWWLERVVAVNGGIGGWREWWP